MYGLFNAFGLVLLLGVTGFSQSAQAQQSTDTLVEYAQLDQTALLALAERGDAQAQFSLGSRYENGQGVEQDDREVERWFKRAAEQGHPGAQAGLGALYALDLQDVPVDYPAALHWSRLAAEQKEVRGYYNLGVIYRDGLGVLQDNRQAIHWFGLAAEQGESWAQYNLGQLYASQESGVQNPALAVDWYLRAAEQGNPAAYHNLGTLFLEGQVVKSDPVLGYALVTVASLKAAPAESDEKAPADEVARNFEMSDAQIAAGRDLARKLETAPRAGVQAYLSSTGNSLEAPADIGSGVRHAL